MIIKCNIHNYLIYHKNAYLFSHFEYVGQGFQADMEKMAADPVIQKWWSICKPC